MRPADGAYCSQCGGLVNWTASPGQLPVGFILNRADGYAYQIGATKGQGGFGITYAGMDLQSANRVAIKEYYPRWCATRKPNGMVCPSANNENGYKGAMTAFLKEAMTLSAVGSLPSVVTVYDCFEANGTAYIVMEYVEGSPLHDVVAKRGHFTAQSLLPLFPELLKDLGVLHRAGIIHRDISPDNLILTNFGKLKLLDFGSARNMNNSQNMTVLLKPGFSPVEQYQSSGQGPYTDIYALASTMYYCLTAVIPPPSFDRLTNDTLQRPNSLGAGLSADQENALMWALAVRPNQRPATAEQFAARLFLKANAIPPQKPRVVTPPPKPIAVAPPPANPQPQPLNVNSQPQPSSINGQPLAFGNSFIHKYSGFFSRIIAFFAQMIKPTDVQASPKRRSIAEKINIFGSVGTLAIAIFSFMVFTLMMFAGELYFDEYFGIVLAMVNIAFLHNLIVAFVAHIVGHGK